MISTLARLKSDWKVKKVLSSTHTHNGHLKNKIEKLSLSFDEGSDVEMPKVVWPWSAGKSPRGGVQTSTITWKSCLYYAMPFGLLRDEVFPSLVDLCRRLIGISLTSPAPESEEIYERYKKCFIHEEGNEQKKTFRRLEAWKVSSFRWARQRIPRRDLPPARC